MLCLAGISQGNSWLYQVNRHNYIRYDQNQLHNFGEDVYSLGFYKKLEKLLETGEGRINIVHIGGSHIQAGTFSGRIRSRLQTLNGEMNAGWGYMFPYHMARTNSPFGYYIRFNGNWQTCRNTQKTKNCKIGVGGIAATTSAPETELTVLLEKENQLDYRFNKIRIYFENEAHNYTFSVDSVLLKRMTFSDGYFDIETNDFVDSLTISLSKKYNVEGSFTLHGITTETAPNGFLYHSIGINGAHVPAFLECELFEQQLATLNPDLVILGLGINDAYGRRFSESQFQQNYSGLLEKIRRSAPETAIILTTNNDSYMYRRYVNKNGEKVKQSMINLSEQFKTDVWDMY